MVKLIDHPCMSICSCHFRYGKLDVVKYLLENSDVDVNEKTFGGDTPLDLARR